MPILYLISTWSTLSAKNWEPVPPMAKNWSPGDSYHLVMTNIAAIAIENGPVEIVDFPIQHGDFNHQDAMGWTIYFPWFAPGWSHGRPVPKPTPRLRPWWECARFPWNNFPEIVSKLEKFQELINTSTQIGTPKSGLATFYVSLCDMDWSQNTQSASRNGVSNSCQWSWRIVPRPYPLLLKSPSISMDLLCVWWCHPWFVCSEIPMACVWNPHSYSNHQRIVSVFQINEVLLNLLVRFTQGIFGNDPSHH